MASAAPASAAAEASASTSSAAHKKTAKEKEQEREEERKKKREADLAAKLAKESKSLVAAGDKDRGDLLNVVYGLKDGTNHTSHPSPQPHPSTACSRLQATRRSQDSCVSE